MVKVKLSIVFVWTHTDTHKKKIGRLLSDDAWWCDIFLYLANMEVVAPNKHKLIKLNLSDLQTSTSLSWAYVYMYILGSNT